MRKTLMASLLALSVAACGGEAGEGEVQEAAETALANGMPAIAGFEEGDVTGEETEQDNAKHDVTYATDSGVAEAFDFYREHYAGKGYEPSSIYINFRAEDTDYGGYVQVHADRDPVMVHVSPNKGSGSFSATTQLGDGFPLYPGVEADGYDINERSSGSRLVIFRIAEDPYKIFEFYRDAGVSEGFEIRDITFSANSDAERVRIGIYSEEEGSKVTASRSDQR